MPARSPASSTSRRAVPTAATAATAGSVFVRADANLTTLLDYRYRTIWKAERGEHGKGKTQTGASADDIYLPVPPGTIIRDADTGELLGEVLRAGDTVRVARGGRGGRGNARFATPTHQAPREWEPGEEGEDRQHRAACSSSSPTSAWWASPTRARAPCSRSSPPRGPRSPTIRSRRSSPISACVGFRGTAPSWWPTFRASSRARTRARGSGLRFLQHVERTRVLAFLIPLDSARPAGRRTSGSANEVRSVQRGAGAEAARRRAHQARPGLAPAIRFPDLDAPEAAGVARRLERRRRWARGAEGVSLEVRRAGQGGGQPSADVAHIPGTGSSWTTSDGRAALA